MLNLNQSNLLEERLESNEKEFQVLNGLIGSKNNQLDYFHEVKTDLFANKMNREILIVMTELLDQDKDINEASVRSHIRMDTNPMKASHLEDHFDILLSYLARDSFSNILKDLEILRKNRILVEELIGTAKSKFVNNEPINDIIKDITESIISMDNSKEDRTTFTEQVDQALREIEDPDKYADFIKLRWKEWNKQFGGVIKDRVYLIGGESGSGKTAVVCDLIGQMSEDYPDDVAILFYSYEMSQTRVITRLISRKVKLTESKITQRVKKLFGEDLNRVKDATEEIKKYPLEIVYQTLSDRELKMRTRRFALKSKGKHLIIFLDHIGLVDGNNTDMRVKTIRTSKILKSFATDYGASVFPLTQLKKELTDENNPNNRKNFHKPNDSHIMESGALKADADAVILLWRPEMRTSHIVYNNVESWDARGKLFMLNYKNRDGQAPNDMILGCDIKYSHLYNLEDPFSEGTTDSVLEDISDQEEVTFRSDLKSRKPFET